MEEHMDGEIVVRLMEIISKRMDSPLGLSEISMYVPLTLITGRRSPRIILTELKILIAQT